MLGSRGFGIQNSKQDRNIRTDRRPSTPGQEHEWKMNCYRATVFVTVPAFFAHQPLATDKCVAISTARIQSRIFLSTKIWKVGGYSGYRDPSDRRSTTTICQNAQFHQMATRSKRGAAGAHAEGPTSA